MAASSNLLEGKTAVITASGSGIGFSIATQLAEAGAHIVLNDIDADALASAADRLSEIDPSVEAVVADGSVPAEMDRVIDRAIDTHDSLDILVNNIGIAGPTKPCQDLSYEEFMGTIETNLGSLFNATSRAIPHLSSGEYGRVINLSSMTGKRPLVDRTPYTTAKMGVIGFTRTLAVELAEEDVTVNAVCPGSVAGPRLEAVIEGQAESQGRPYADVEEEFLSVSPMKQFVQPEDIASLVVFLCSKKADRITGQDINVTAGVAMY